MSATVGIALLALLGLTSSASAYKTCVVPFGGGGIDDTPGLTAMLPNCSTDANIVFEAGNTYNISTPINFGNLTNVEISILGNLDHPQSIPYVQSLVNASSGSLYWYTVTGTNITISGSQDPSSGFIDPYGVPWWQAAPVTLPLGGLANRPHLMKVSANNTVIRWLKVRKPVAWGISVSGNNNHIYGNHIDAAYDLDNPSVFPFNTDGYDISGNNVTVEDGYVSNGDDCVAVNKGNNITVQHMVCVGGHGASLSATTGVSNVLFYNITSRNSLYATRFKSSLNSVGNITNVTWSNIHVINATFPIFATGEYFDQNTNRGLTPGNLPSNSTATHISNFKWENIYGTINDVYPGDGSCVTDPCWYYVANATKNAGVTLQLLNGTATNIQVLDVDLKPVDGNGVSNVLCDPSSFTDGVDNLGFKCVNGPFVPT